MTHRLGSIARDARRFFYGHWFVVILFLLGIGLRSAQYLADRSLWGDETFVALNLIRYSVADLVRQPLEYGVVLPPAFLLLEGLVVWKVGASELALRFVPFLFGLTAMFLFFKVAPRVVRPRAVPFALLFFTIAPSLIYYTSELKPYIGDVAISLLLTLLALEVHARHVRAMPALALTAAGVLAPWFSFASVFVLAGLGLTLGVTYMRERSWEKVWRVGTMSFFWLLSFGILYFNFTKSQLDTLGLDVVFEKEAYVLLPEASIHGLRKSLEHLGWLLLQGLHRPVGFELVGLAALAFILGVVSMLEEKRLILSMIVAPIMVALAASAAGMYPFLERMLLFAVPPVLLVISEGVAWTLERTYKYAPAIPMSIILILVIPVVYATAIHARNLPIHYKNNEDVRSVLEYFKAHRQPGDEVFVYPNAEPHVIYYSHRLGIAPIRYRLLDVGEERDIWGRAIGDDWNEHAEALEELRQYQRVWIFFYPTTWGGMQTIESFYRERLGAMGKQVEAVRAWGMSAYLFDLSD